MALYRNGKPLTEEDIKALGGADTAAPAPKGEPGWFEPGSTSEAALRGFSNAATLGLGKWAGGALDSFLNGQPASAGVQSELAANQASQEAHPWAYGAGSLAGAAPMAAGGGALVNTAGPAITTLADTRDPTAALGAGALAAAIPLAGEMGAAAGKVAPKALDWLANKTGATTTAAEDLANQIRTASTPGSSVARAAKTQGISLPQGFPSRDEALAMLETKMGKSDPTQLLALKQGGTDQEIQDALMAYNKPGRPGPWSATQATHKGLNDLADTVAGDASSINQPQWAGIKSILAAQNPAEGVGGFIGDAYKGVGMGGAAGGLIGSHLGASGGAIGTAIGGAAGAAGAVKGALVNRAKQQVLSPAAEKGVSILQKALATPAGQAAAAGGKAARWAAITNVLNQTSPEARAALNSESPLNNNPGE